MQRSALPVLLLTLLLGLLMQGMLAGLVFSTGLTEWLYRGLYIVALVLNLVLVKRVNPGSIATICLALSPMVMAALVTWISIADQLANPVTLLMVPMLHSAICCILMAVRWPEPGDADL